MCGSEPVPLLDRKKEDGVKEDSEHLHGVAVPVAPGVHQPITPKKPRETQDPGTAFYTTSI
jgi:hypothetical protein